MPKKRAGEKGGTEFGVGGQRGLQKGLHGKGRWGTQLGECNNSVRKEKGKRKRRGKGDHIKKESGVRLGRAGVLAIKTNQHNKEGGKSEASEREKKTVGGESRSSRRVPWKSDGKRGGAPAYQGKKLRKKKVTGKKR